MIEILLLAAMVVVITQVTWAKMPNMENFTKMQSPWKYGYHYGILDGKDNARDATSTCSSYNSTAENNECAHGYDLGFKKGCEIATVCTST